MYESIIRVEIEGREGIKCGGFEWEVEDFEFDILFRVSFRFIFLKFSRDNINKEELGWNCFDLFYNCSIIVKCLLCFRIYFFTVLKCDDKELGKRIF